jgi:hypothetical protein
MLPSHPYTSKSAQHHLFSLTLAHYSCVRQLGLAHAQLQYMYCCVMHSTAAPDRHIGRLWTAGVTVHRPPQVYPRSCLTISINIYAAAVAIKPPHMHTLCTAHHHHTLLLAQSHAGCGCLILLLLPPHITAALTDHAPHMHPFVQCITQPSSHGLH